MPGDKPLFAASPRARSILRPPLPDPRARPNGEADPRRLRIGRAYETAWLFVFDEGSAVGTVVYELYARGANGLDAAPSYVGITSDFAARWSSHRQHSWWFTHLDVEVALVEGFATRSEARKREALLIEEHQPQFNTKVERKYLRLARHSPEPRAVFAAELHRRGFRHGP